MRNNPIAAMLMAALSGRRDGECFCGGHHGEEPSLAEATAFALKKAKAERDALDTTINLLENPTRDGKQLVAITNGIIMFKGEPSMHTFAAYGTENEGDEDFTLVYKDSRTGGEKVFNVHGMEAVDSTINSIRSKLQAEFVAKAEADAATQKAAQPDTSEGQPS